MLRMKFSYYLYDVGRVLSCIIMKSFPTKQRKKRHISKMYLKAVKDPPSNIINFGWSLRVMPPQNIDPSSRFVEGHCHEK